MARIYICRPFKNPHALPYVKAAGVSRYVPIFILGLLTLR